MAFDGVLAVADSIKKGAYNRRGQEVKVVILLAILLIIITLLVVFKLYRKIL